MALSEKILIFGLLQSTETVQVYTGYGLSIHFLDLTIQEYLASLHLAKTWQSLELNKLMLDFKLREHFSSVWRFFFGIYFSVKGNNDSAPIKLYLSCISNELIHCQCAFEARNDFVNDIILKQVRFKFMYPKTPYDCATVLYVIDKMQECHNMSITFTNCMENQFRTLIDVLSSKDGKLQIENLYLNGNTLTNASLTDLFSRASNALLSLKKLHLGNEIMTRTGLSGNNLRTPLILQALESAVSVNHLAKLEDLNLSGCLTNDVNTSEAELETFLKSLSDHCPHLNMLNLSNNNLGVPGVSALAAAISQHNYLKDASCHYDSWLMSINLNNTKLGDEGLHAFVEELGHPYCFCNLHLQNNGIHATGLTYLFDLIRSDTLIDSDWYLDYVLESCEELDLAENPIGIEGVITVGEVLSVCCQKYVNLCSCHLTTAVENTSSCSSDDIFRDLGWKLCQVPQNSTITVLFLDENCFTGERIHILAGFIRICEFLTSLSCYNCNITSDDFIQLLVILSKSNTSYPLESWNLEDNTIDDNGLSELLHHMPSLFPSMGNSYDTEVYLEGNPISAEMLDKLEQSLYSLRR